MSNDCVQQMQTIWNDLTSEQREQVKQLTTQDWIDALVSCIQDPDFWKGIAIAFFEGVEDGIKKHKGF